MPNGSRQCHAQLGFEHWVLEKPSRPKTVEFCDLLGTAYATVSKIPSVNGMIMPGKEKLEKGPFQKKK